MFVELIDKLRCLRPHEESWLVASAVETVDRHIVEGTLGCPACGAEYPIHEAAVWFGGTEIHHAPVMHGFGEDAEIRLAAQLGLDERGGLYVLEGAWALFATGVAARFPSARFVCVSTMAVADAELVLRCTGDALPLAPACARGIALSRDAHALVAAAERVLAPHGRLVVPAGAPVPGSITVLARDSDQWVGERDASSNASAPVTPRRAGPRTGSR